VPPDGVVHVLNRANRRATMFTRGGDYDSFADLLAEGLSRERVPLTPTASCRITGIWYCVSPTVRISRD